MKVACVIPARFGSTRFPGKPLVEIRKKPLIQWVVEGAKKAKTVSDVIVATDHQEIAEAAKKAGALVVMTDSDLPSGSDRIFAATKKLNYDIIINIQGDEPLVNADWIDSMAKELSQNSSLSMATFAHPLHEADIENKNAVKVILNKNHEAIYFSRWPIPFSRKSYQEIGSEVRCYKHIGVYGYQAAFLKTFCETPPSSLEIAESLEQLRALDLGAKIKVFLVNEATLGIDTPEDLVKFEQHLLAKGI